MKGLLFISQNEITRGEWKRMFAQICFPKICYTCVGAETQKRLGCNYPMKGEKPCKYKNFSKLRGLRAFFGKDKCHVLLVQKTKSSEPITTTTFGVAQQFAKYNGINCTIIDLSRNFDLAEKVGEDKNNKRRGVK